MRRLEIKETGTYENGGLLKFRVLETPDLHRIFMVPQTTMIGNSFSNERTMFHAVIVWHANVEDIRADLEADLPISELPEFPGVNRAVWVDSSGFACFWIPGDGIYVDHPDSQIGYHYQGVRGKFLVWESGIGQLEPVFPKIPGLTWDVILGRQGPEENGIGIQGEVTIDEGLSTED